MHAFQAELWRQISHSMGRGGRARDEIMRYPHHFEIAGNICKFRSCRQPGFWLLTPADRKRAALI
jgi:hypothetical protein